MLQLYITWDPNPEMLNIAGFAVRWYGLLFASAFFFGYLIFQKIFKSENIPAEVLDHLTIYMLIGVVVGARLGHCLFYEPEYYFAHPFQILNLRQGGLASHGAAIGILLSLWFFARKEKLAYSWIVDRIVIVVALSGLFIRTGNLMNSEIIGSPTTVSWAFIFKQVPVTQEIYANLSENLQQYYNLHGNIPRHPAQVYEALAYLSVCALLIWLYFKKSAGSKPFFMTGLFMVLVFGFRFIVEFFKDVQVDFEKTLPLNMGQWLSIPIILLGIVLIFSSLKKTQK